MIITNGQKGRASPATYVVYMSISNPSEEHVMLREMVRDWVNENVEPQAFEYDKEEKFNLELLRSMGEMGLLGISAPEEY